MAQGSSPRVSPNRHLQQRSPSPPSQPQSKRDKQRSKFYKELADMIKSFTANHHDHFYAQLTALQCDINMIMRAQPYNQGPLPDTGKEIQEQANAVREEICRPRPIPEVAQPSFDALVGKYYGNFVHDVNAAMERRDRDLTLLFNEHESRVEDIRQQHQYKVQLAHEEHALLYKTLRERLITQLHNKRKNMLKDKEQLDIADSNALLLNSNQFSILNPSSPGGTHQNRKTRHTRGRPGDVDESGTQIQDSRRKRKTALDENDNGSPGPTNRTPEVGTSTPQFDNKRAKLAYSQFEAPVYSIDKLFSERELQININRAHVNSAEFFRQLRAQGIESRLHNAVNGATSNGNGINTNTATSANGSLNDLAEVASTSAPQADNNPDSNPDEPTAHASPHLSNAQTATSGPYHATRSSQRGGAATAAASTFSGTGNPLTDLANTATSLAPYTVTINTNPSKATNPAPTPTPATDAELASDLNMMQRETRDDAVYEKLIQLACEKQSLVGLPPVKPGAMEQASAAAPTSAPMARQLSAMGGVPMSKTSSAMSDLGSVTRRGR